MFYFHPIHKNCWKLIKNWRSHVQLLSEKWAKECLDAIIGSCEPTLKRKGYVKIFNSLHNCTCTLRLLKMETIEMFHDLGDVRMPLFTTKERTQTCSDL